MRAEFLIEHCSMMAYEPDVAITAAHASSIVVLLHINSQHLLTITGLVIAILKTH